MDRERGAPSAQDHDDLLRADVIEILTILGIDPEKPMTLREEVRVNRLIEAFRVMRAGVQAEATPEDDRVGALISSASRAALRNLLGGDAGATCARQRAVCAAEDPDLRSLLEQNELRSGTPTARRRAEDRFTGRR